MASYRFASVNELHSRLLVKRPAWCKGLVSAALDVLLTPKATELLRRREMSRCATNRKCQNVSTISAFGGVIRTEYARCEPSAFDRRQIPVLTGNALRFDKHQR